MFLGIDTSAYTSSLAMVDENNNIIFDERLMLKVKEGERGLRQSEALFLHIKNLPFLFEKLPIENDNNIIKAIAVSAFPRNVEGSYMPVFTAGLSVARTISAFCKRPLYEVSHQEGHIMAGLSGNIELFNKESFLAVHFSGGTSEVVRVKKNEGKQHLFEVDLLANGLDLHAGQLVDRVGVAMGLPFPAGPYIEKMACLSAAKEIPMIPSVVKQSGFSFSGAETRALTMIKAGIAHEDIAFALLRCLANTLEKVILMNAETNNIRDVLLVGGVMANLLIRERLIKRLEHPGVGLKLYFAHPHLSADNAAGVAMLAALLNKR